MVQMANFPNRDRVQLRLFLGSLRSNCQHKGMEIENLPRTKQYNFTLCEFGLHPCFLLHLFLCLLGWGIHSTKVKNIEGTTFSLANKDMVLTIILGLFLYVGESFHRRIPRFVIHGLIPTFSYSDYSIIDRSVCEAILRMHSHGWHHPQSGHPNDHYSLPF